MTHPPRSRPRTVLYIAEAAAAARDGAAALEAVDSGPDRTVQPLSTSATDQLRSWAPEADCVVFAETPTTAAGASLLEIVDACGRTPLVLFCERSYAPTAARSTDGIAGYVRRGTDDAVAHLADEIEWVCHGAAVDGDETSREEAIAETGRAADVQPNDPAETTADETANTTADETTTTNADETADTRTAEEPLALEPVRPGDVLGSAAIAESNDSAETDERAAVVSSLESSTELAAWRDHESGRERCYELLVEFVADACGTDYCWLSTVHFGECTTRAATDAVPDDTLESMPLEGPVGDAFRTGEPLRIEDTEDAAIEPPFEDAASLCVAPVADVGIVQIADTEPSAFDETTGELLAACCRYAAAILERAETRTRLRAERDRFADGRDRLAAERDRIGDERDRLAADRDRLNTAFTSLPVPALRYELVDDRAVVRAVTGRFTDTFDVDRSAVVDSAIGGADDGNSGSSSSSSTDGADGDNGIGADEVGTDGDGDIDDTDRETTVPPGLEDRALTLADAVRSTEQRQFVSRRETADGIRTFRLTVAPCSTVPDCEPTDDTVASDEPTEGVVVYTDVTDANRMERELAAVEHRLETIAQLVDEDVRTPLNVARGYLELAAETGDREHFDEIDDAQEQLLALVEQLLTIARRDDVLVDTEPVALHDVARRAWVVVETGGARLVTEEDLVLKADKSRIQELFEHLFRAIVHGEETTEHDGSGPKWRADEGTIDDEAITRITDEQTVVSVGTADDGFYVTGRWDGANRAVAGVKSGADLGRLATCDGAGFGLDPIERIADAHGWDIGIAEDDDRIAFAFRGVECDADGS
ncbi:GAF domain-containing sensor histidine kinase [Natronorubrum texcoconense]|nr:histidine kinase dimerization/phospho-acceptor domain-containing protein [Natronorubrum texcoconense]